MIKPIFDTIFDEHFTHIFQVWFEMEPNFETWVLAEDSLLSAYQIIQSFSQSLCAYEIDIFSHQYQHFHFKNS